MSTPTSPTAAKPFNLATRSVRSTITVELVDPADGKTPTGAAIEMHARSSDAARLNIIAVGEEERVAVEKDPDAKLHWTDRLVRVMARNVIRFDRLADGDTVPAATPEGALALFLKYPWVREQAQAAYLEGEAFFDATAERTA